MVSLCFEAISTEWGKQIPWSFKSYLGIFKQNVQDKLKVPIHFRAVSHSAWSEIVPAVLTAFALAWSRGKVLPFPLLWMAALLPLLLGLAVSALGQVMLPDVGWSVCSL